MKELCWEASAASQPGKIQPGKMRKRHRKSKKGNSLIGLSESIFDEI